MLKTFLPISCFEISYIQNWKGYDGVIRFN